MSGTMRWAGNVACTGDNSTDTKFWSENLKEETTPRPRRRCEDNIRVDLRDGKDGKLWTGFIWFRTGISGGSRGHGNEPTGSIKGGEFD